MGKAQQTNIFKEHTQAIVKATIITIHIDQYHQPIIRPKNDPAIGSSKP